MKAKKAAPTGPRYYAFPVSDDGTGWILKTCAEPGHNLKGAPHHFPTAEKAREFAAERGWGPERKDL